MAKQSKALSVLVSASGWLSSVFPAQWAAVLTATGATLLLWLSAGARIFTSPEFIGAALIFVLILWTLIGLFWLAGRRRPVEVFIARDYSYGLTFQGLSAIWDIRNEDATLQLAIALHNYCPGPLRYSVEKFDVRIDTRSLPDLEIATTNNFLPRGAQRPFYQMPFKKAHVQEFLGKRQEGTVSISIAYGDVEKPPSRRLSMSFTTFFAFPVEGGALDHLGFNSIISSEKDEAIKS